MLEQYLSIKSQYQDHILFFRLGDFYEMFYDDAITASSVLEITLTKKRVGGEEGTAPLCGVPYHAAEGYIAKLIENGYKVAVCEQTEDPKLAKGIVKREVIRVITPGTVTGDTMLSAGDNNYLASIYEQDDAIGLAWCDISTGELGAALLSGAGRISQLEGQLSRIDVREIVVNEDSAAGEALRQMDDCLVSALPEPYFEADKGAAAAQAIHYAHAGGAPVQAALYGLFSYLEETAKQELTHIKPLEFQNLSDHMLLDRASIRNLELTETLFERKVKGSLLGVLDKTHTAMGGRLLKKWLKNPLIGTPQIARRLDAVETLYDDVLLRNNIKTELKAVYDLERLAGRISFGNANARDLVALNNSAAAIPEIKNEICSLEPESDSLLAELNAQMSEHSDLRALIDTAIVDEPPFTLREGGMIRSGYSPELDEMRDSIADGQRWIAELEGKERERTGIKSLKVGFNRVFGYYIDVTNAHKELVPEEYIRKQTLVGSERYITPEMKEIESVVLGAEARINETEYRIFGEIRQQIDSMIPEIQRTSEALAVLDVLTSFAEVAEKNGYTKPVVDDGDRIEIIRGRHPVIEFSLSNGPADGAGLAPGSTSFVPNDVFIDLDQASTLLITGPNMAGKSTYMRQTALIVLMAQAGCFVPAERARIGVCDRLYTRIGASDNLAKGESTFFVEMNELAYILNTATDRSLVILDEIGRGTSTYDGLAIAWAVLDRMCADQTRMRCLFATHYHELTLLEDQLRGMVNLNTGIAESGGEVVFLHKIEVGSASRSYGIHVAKLAGIPQTVLDDAQIKLDLLEEERTDISDSVQQSTQTAQRMPDTQSASNAQSIPDAQSAQNAQISMFDFAPNPVVERLRALNLMEITPSQAFQILEELKKAAQ
jgi:DNA mismatch repair protein MutS